MAHGNLTRNAIAKVVDSLETQIIFGFLLPRQRLYEDEFIYRYDTKRHVIRAALEELERRGIVERVPNRGATVKLYSREEVEAIYVVRAILHEAAARRIRLPADLLWLDTLRRAQETHGEAIVKSAPVILLRNSDGGGSFMLHLCKPFVTAEFWKNGERLAYDTGVDIVKRICVEWELGSQIQHPPKVYWNNSKN